MPRSHSLYCRGIKVRLKCVCVLLAAREQRKTGKLFNRLALWGLFSVHYVFMEITCVSYLRAGAVGIDRFICTAELHFIVWVYRKVDDSTADDKLLVRMFAGQLVRDWPVRRKLESSSRHDGR